MTAPEGPYIVKTLPRSTHTYHDWHYIRGPVNFAAGFDKRDEAQQITDRLNFQHVEIQWLQEENARLGEDMKAWPELCGQVQQQHAEIERLQAELVELRALADKRHRDELDEWCQREGECWLLDGPCAGYHRGKESPLLQAIEADDTRSAEFVEELQDTISEQHVEIERLRSVLAAICDRFRDLHPELQSPDFVLEYFGGKTNG